MKNKAQLIMEIIWIITGIVSLAAGVIYATHTGGPRVLIFLSMAAVSFLFARYRHMQRKKS